MPDIYFLDFDDHNEAKLARHGLVPEEILQLLSERHITRQNPKGPAARIQLIGQTHGGRVLTVLLDPTDDPSVWRPVTGWDAEAEETKLFDRYGR
ncbi:MAG: hypothetical protein ACR2G3_05215 [Solirubrobacterales bacterium]